ncbi:SDR family oxidoreductase [Streptomyces sp. NPDC127068]|uniref:SDR family oxidoreductase n=1 Tax=Streptomyces sp. NPDC127068 TaxID=3347127 RepID=UPI00365C42F3
MPPTPQEPAESAGSLSASSDVRTRIAGRNVLITGGSQGFGRALAQSFLEHGARVAITGRDCAVLARAHAALTPHGELRTDSVDSTDLTAQRELARHLHADWGATDVLVANAGTLGPVGPAWEADPAQWWSVQETNLRGTFLTCHAFIPHLRERGGRLVIITSNAGRHRWPHASAYSVSKAGGIKLAENLALELRPHGVSVFAYHPGLLTIGLSVGGMRKHTERGSWEERIQQWYRVEHAEGRTTPTDVAVRGALLLAAGAADHLTGEYVTYEHPDLTGRLQW